MGLWGAYVIPATFGLIWLVSPASVFYIGAAMAAVSLILSLNIPIKPEEGNEVRILRWSDR
ncbi:hypothetical protein THOG05_380001 [Vibrio rotiferianus]|nr:hypothetical protein THOG05_380001 [Vibrio rotiferianus]